MTTNTLKVIIKMDKTPEEAFAAICDVGGWWSSGTIEGDATALGSRFTYQYADIHRSVQKVTELVPGKRVVWHVEEGNLSFVTHKNEWTGTDIIFDIEEEGGQTVKPGVDSIFLRAGHLKLGFTRSRRTLASTPSLGERSRVSSC